MRPYFQQVVGLLALGAIGGIVMNTAVVLPAILLGRMIDTALAWERGEATTVAVGWAALAYIGGVALVQGPRVVKRWGFRVGNQRIMASIRADALRGVLAWPMERVHQIPIGDLMARIIGDVEVLGRGVRELTTESFDTVLFSISLIVALLAYDVRLTLLALLPVPAAMVLSHATGRWVSARTTAAREANAALIASLQERLSGLRVLRLFGRIEATVDHIAALSAKLADANLAIIRLRSGLQPVYSLMMTAGVVFVIWLGGDRVVAGAMTVGTFVAYLQLYLRFVRRGFRVPQLLNSVQRGAAAYARLEPLLAPPMSLEDEPPLASIRSCHVPGLGHPAPPLPSRPGKPVQVSLEGVTFRYPGGHTPALDDVWLEIPAGALVAVTGPVGSGKSALARVLLGLYPLESGRVLLDGQPLDSLPQAKRAACIGYLPQDPYLFSGTIRENILLSLSSASPDAKGTDGMEQRVNELIELVALREDMDTFPDGLDTEIGEQGIRISGGQRQRIALARAIAATTLHTPGLLVLDDPFSSVDVDTEAQIIARLREAFGPSAPPERQATIAFFSHRLAAFPQADLVVVLNGGRIVEQGTHDELIRRGGLYSRIYFAQQRTEPSTTLAERHT